MGTDNTFKPVKILFHELSRHTDNKLQMKDITFLKMFLLYRVHGLEGLRVIDSSVMPQIVSGDTYAAEVMIAEKASDLIAGRVEPVKSDV